MENSYDQIPPMPPLVWAAIWKITKRGKDAVIKIRDGKIQVLETERKITYRAELN